MHVSEVVGQVRDLFLPLVAGSAVELLFDIDPDLPGRVVGDAIRVQQVLINLVGNACKFTPRGRVTLDLCALPPTRPGHCRIFFAVSDTGIGIPDDKLRTLFKPFSQVGAGYTRSHQGAGLGLSICKRLVELMGGCLSVVSEPGVGSIMAFSLQFPVVSSPERVLPVPAGAAGARLDGLHILLAEDDAISAMAALALLRRRGAEVVHVEDGLAVLAAVARERFDVVLMDVQMPELDGVEATRRLREGAVGAAGQTLPVVAMTAYAMAGDRERFLAVGMNGYVAKPVNMDDLLVVLRDVLPG